jgi:hypothetical protein
MRRHAGRDHIHAHAALVLVADIQIGRLGDDEEAAAPALLDQPADAVDAADLLVRDELHAQIGARIAPGQVFEQPQQHRRAALHVLCAAAIDPAVAHDRLELLGQAAHHVEMRVQHQRRRARLVQRRHDRGLAGALRAVNEQTGDRGQLTRDILSDRRQLVGPVSDAREADQRAGQIDQLGAQRIIHSSLL